MAFEFNFDDEIFQESNCRTKVVSGIYNPKLCDPEVCFYWVFKLFLLKAALIWPPPNKPPSSQISLPLFSKEES